MEVWEWVTAEGDPFRLDGSIDGAEVVANVEGRFMPPIRRNADIVPLQPGSRLRSVVHGESEVSLGIYFSAADAIAQRANLREWMFRLDPTRGPGKLRVTGPAGNVRELSCSYKDGLGLIEPPSPDRRRKQVAVLTLIAHDPYWAESAPTVVSWSTGAPRAFFPLLPFHLGSSQVFARALVDPLGDVATYPVWTINGPGSTISIRNVTTGRTLAWSGSLGFGELLTIDTRPGNQTSAPKSVFLQDGSNQFGLLTAWDFWPLEPGTNDIEITMTGATDDSQVTGSWQARHLSA